MPRFEGTPVNRRFAGTPVKRRFEGIPESLRAPSAVEQQSAINQLNAPTGRFAQPGKIAKARKLMGLAELQDKYGDEKTFRAAGKNNWYDEEELRHRALVDELGFTPKPIEGFKAPFIHLGKEFSDLGTGARLMNPFGDKEKKEDLYNQYQMENNIYTAADKSIGDQVVGSLLPAVPFGIANTTTKALVGSYLKRRFGKEVGEKMLQKASMQGAWASPKVVPGSTGATEGGLYGLLQPTDPSLDFTEQAWQKGSNALITGLIGGGAELGMRGVGRLGQQRATQDLQRELQGNLPKPLDAPTPLLYGDSATYGRIKEIARQSYKTPDQDITKIGAQAVTERFDRGIQNNLRELNRTMTGTTNQEIGASIAPVMKAYKDEFNMSKSVMDLKYKRLNQDYGPVRGDLETFKFMMNDIDSVIANEGLLKTKAAKTAYNELKSIIKDAGKDADSFNAKNLIGKYKVLNNAFSDAKTKPQQVTINKMKEMLSNYMQDSANFRGDTSVMDAFFDATSTAADHYKRYMGIKGIDRYLKGEITANDISRNLFAGTALDATEGPKAQMLDRIITVVPGSEKALKNEVFSHFSDELAPQKRMPEAVNSIKGKILSGSDEGIYGRLFDEGEMGQFKRIVEAADLKDMPAPTMTQEKLKSMQDMTSRGVVNPMRILNHPWIPGKGKSAIDKALIDRAERGLISPIGGVTGAAGIPLFMESAREQKRLDALGLLN